MAVAVGAGVCVTVGTEVPVGVALAVAVGSDVLVGVAVGDGAAWSIACPTAVMADRLPAASMVRTATYTVPGGNDAGACSVIVPLRWRPPCVAWLVAVNRVALANCASVLTGCEA